MAMVSHCEFSKFETCIAINAYLDYCRIFASSYKICESQKLCGVMLMKDYTTRRPPAILNVKV